MDSPLLENVFSVIFDKWTKLKSKSKPILFHNHTFWLHCACLKLIKIIDFNL